MRWLSALSIITPPSAKPPKTAASVPIRSQPRGATARVPAMSAHAGNALIKFRLVKTSTEIRL